MDGEYLADGCHRIQVPILSGHVHLEPQPDSAVQVPLMDHVSESSEIDHTPAALRPLDVQVVPLENLLRVLNGVQDRALPRAVGPEQQRDRLQVDAHPIADALEVLDL